MITPSSILPLCDRLLQFYMAPWHEVCPELSAWGLTSMEVAQLGVLSCCFGDRCYSNCIDTYKKKTHSDNDFQNKQNFFLTKRAMNQNTDLLRCWSDHSRNLLVFLCDLIKMTHWQTD